jgi:putative hemolysin
MGYEPFLMVGLLVFSAGFSASETALFNLGPADEREAGAKARALLEHPRALLVGILLGNLVVNVLFFAFAASWLAQFDPVHQVAGNLAFLGCVVLFGEVLPKTLALRGSARLARLLAPPLSVFVALVAPLRRAADVALEWIYKALGPSARSEDEVTTQALALALERSAKQGLLLENEASILAALVELEDVRVRELMTPRVEMLFVDVSGEGREQAARAGVEQKAPWVIVIDGAPDTIVGRVRVRSLLMQPHDPIEKLIEPCHFVPEVSSALRTLQFLRERGVAQAVVVDEWGGTAGMVTVESIFEEFVGDLRVEGELAERAVAPLSDGSFEVDGGLSIREWNEFFGGRVAPREFETLGGLVSALLGRIPRTGDRVSSGPLEFEVLSTRRRRVGRVRVKVRAQRREEARA